LIASTLGFFFGPWFGVGSFLTGIAFSGTGMYLTVMRRRQYDDELLRTRAELRRLMADDATRARTVEWRSPSTTLSPPLAAAAPP
jgi:hypothetical protein